MKRLSIVLALLLLVACGHAPSVQSGSSLTGGWVLFPPLSPATLAEFLPPGCPPDGWGREKLQEFKAGNFDIADDEARQSFALRITACLASPDPELRDGIAYEALAHMLRERQLSDETMRNLLNDLTTRLQPERADVFGYGNSFAVLALSEVARADRIEAFLTEDELARLLVEAQHWFINIDDYRGFNDAEGWRHAIAHGSDLLMQLALNPRIDAEGLRLIVSAIGVKVAPDEHAYIHGEPERLARPILFAAQRSALTEAEWTEWLTALATLPEPDKVFTSEAGLAWRHNTMSFLMALYTNVTLSAEPALRVLRPGLEAALKAMP